MRLLKLVPDDTNIQFLRWRVPFFVFSLVLIMGSWGLVLGKGLNFGVDFAGGLEVRATYTQSEVAPVAEIRQQLEQIGYESPTVQQFGDDNQVSIRVSLSEDQSGDKEAAQEAANAIVAELRDAHPDFRLDGNDNVSGKVSGEFRNDAALALALAMIAVALYIWVRFEWQFGVGALFALLHDTSIALGFYALTQIEFSLQSVAAVLAIIGYSLNDTVVVYDRIRENLKKYRKMPMVELLDLSVNETLSRTVMTTLSLALALLPLILFGPASLFGMAAPLFLALIVGTYSSVYLAAPLLIWLGVTSDSFVPAPGKNLAHARGNRFRGPFHQDPAIGGADQLAHATHIGGDDGRAAGERFDPRIRQPLAAAWQYHRIRCRQDQRQQIVVNTADEMHAFGHAQVSGQTAQMLLILSSADEQQPRIWQIRQRANRQILPLAGDQGAGRDQQRPVLVQCQSQCLAQSRAKARMAKWAEPVTIETGVVNRDLAALHSHRGHVARERFRHGEQADCTPRRV